MFNKTASSSVFKSHTIPGNPWQRHPLPAKAAAEGADAFIYGDPWLYSLVDSSGTKGTEHTRSSSTGLWWQSALDVTSDADGDVDATGWYQDNNTILDCGPMQVNDYVIFDLHGTLNICGATLSGRTDSNGLWLAGFEVFVTTDTNADNAFFDDSGFTYTSVGTYDWSAEFLAEAGAPADVENTLEFTATNATYVKIVCTSVHGVGTEPDWGFSRVSFKALDSQIRYKAGRSGLVKEHRFLDESGWVAFSDHPDADIDNEDALTNNQFDASSAVFNLGTNGDLDFKIEGPALTVSRIVFGGYNLGLSIPDDIAVYLREAGGSYVYYKKLKLEDGYRCQLDLASYTTTGGSGTFQPHLIIPQAEYTGFRFVATKSGGGTQFWAINSISLYNEYLVAGTNPNQLSNESGTPILDGLTNIVAAWSTAPIGKIRPEGTPMVCAEISGSKEYYLEDEVYDGTLAADTLAATAAGYAKRFIDRSGNGHHLYIDSASYRPLLTATSTPWAPFADKAMQFNQDAYMEALDASAFNFAGGHATIFFVASQNSAAVDNCWLLSKSRSGGFFVRFVDPGDATNGGKMVLVFYKAGSTAQYGIFRTESNTFDDDTLRVFCIKIDATDTADVTARLWVNGSEITFTQTYGPDGTWDDNEGRQLCIGSWDESPTTTAYQHDGKLDSIIWCSAAIADATIASVSAELMTVHGIT